MIKREKLAENVYLSEKKTLSKTWIYANKDVNCNKNLILT